MDSSSIVIKVKFGETLRRINASINDKKLVLNMVMLKEKIRDLFSFGSDVEFTMTYVDEDGDAVTLADDDDLHDVARQSLNPLRITVNLKSSHLNGPSGKSTSQKSPQNQHPSQILNSSLKYLSVSLLKALAKLPPDVAAKLSHSDPVVAELVKRFKDVSSNQTLPSMDRLTVLPAIGGQPNASSESSTCVNPETGGSNSKKKEKQVQKVTEGVKFKDIQPPRGVDLTNPYFEYESFQAPISSRKRIGEDSTGKDKNTTDGVEKKKDSSSKKKDDSGESMNESLKHDGLASPQYGEQIKQKSQCLQDPMLAKVTQFAHVAADINKNTNDCGSSSGWAQGTLNATNQCPFSGMPLTSDTDSQGHYGQSLSPHWKRESLYYNGMGNIYHRGVGCDGCGVHPITGPRFKSKVKDDYDLCNFCFAGMGNATDYIRMDLPVNSFRHHFTPFNGFYPVRSSLHAQPMMMPQVMLARGSKPSQLKLDSQFILHVNVLDGTIMAPFTAFTKIWRMRNNGSISWPYGSQLQWVGGDRLNKLDSVDVEIPVDGLPVGKELDITVDFTAPKLPGPYVSCWMMASPSGKKFGQRVWVSMKVVDPMKNLGKNQINLNLPPLMNDLDAVIQDHVADNIISGNNIITGSENTSVGLPHKDQEMNFPINDSLIIDNGGVSSTMATLSAPPATASSSAFNFTVPAGPTVTSASYPTLGLGTELISYPTVDYSVMPPLMSTGAASLPKVVVPPALYNVPPPPPTLATLPSGSGGGVISDQEQALVKDLEEMGFKQKDLNKKILRMNNYDMEKSLDDLCGVLEWDPMLDELQEMGFADDEANMKLLKKNNGSIKRAVMDLINEEKA